MQKNNLMQSEQAGAGGAVAQKSPARNVATSTGQHSMDDTAHLDGVSSARTNSANQTEKENPLQSQQAVAVGTVAQESPARNAETSTVQHSMENTAHLADVPPANKASSSNKGTRKKVKTPLASQRSKTRRRSRGKAKHSVRSDRKLQDTHAADDDAILQQHEDNLAELMSKNKDQYAYTEKDLMSTYTPEIIDHKLIKGRNGKFLVQWKKSAPSEGNDNCCLQWIGQEDFLFPVLACNYLSKKVSDTCDNEIEDLKLWMRDNEKREVRLNLSNTFDGEEEEEERDSQLEIDFCCFLCKCPREHPLKHTIRECEFGLKFHRACCHGYDKLEDVNSFRSPVGKGIAQFYGIDDASENSNKEGETQNKTTDNPASSAPEKNVAETSQGTNSVSCVDGACEKFHRCTTLKGKLDVVVVCINAGVGSATVALKGLGVKMAKVIHVEADKVAQHVIQGNHDYHYGDTDDDDGIEHIVGLYERLADIQAKNLVQRHGPISE